MTGQEKKEKIPRGSPIHSHRPSLQIGKEKAGSPLYMMKHRENFAASWDYEGDFLEPS